MYIHGESVDLPRTRLRTNMVTTMMTVNIIVQRPWSDKVFSATLPAKTWRACCEANL